MSSPKRLNLVDTPGLSPDVCLLSNGRYSVMFTASGGGYSAREGMDVTRWREDATRDCWGQFCYVRDLDEGHVWSAGHQPIGRTPTSTRRICAPTRRASAGATATSRPVARSPSRPSRRRGPPGDLDQPR